MLCLLFTPPVLGLLNFFGQGAGSSVAGSPVVTLHVQSPARLRGGLLYQARFEIDAHQNINHAILVLDPNWLEGMTVNTIEPSPNSEQSEHGRLALFLGSINAGDKWTEYLQFQVNPTSVGERDGNVALYDRTRRLVSLARAATVFP